MRRDVVAHAAGSSALLFSRALAERTREAHAAGDEPDMAERLGKVPDALRAATPDPLDGPPCSDELDGRGCAFWALR